MKRVYFVISDAINHHAAWDTFSGAFDTEREAIDHAEMLWEHLTPGEQRNQTVSVCYDDVDVADDASLTDAYNASVERGEGYYVSHEWKYRED